MIERILDGHLFAVGAAALLPVGTGKLATDMAPFCQGGVLISKKTEALHLFTT